jgi:eukaryotic-like serine/threonine-protein kinase
MDSLNHTLTPGTIVGRYRIVRPLGEGGMGVVYEAEHTGLKKRVAIKTLHSTMASDPSIRARFLREGEAASKIRHPNVVDISDIIDDGAFPYLVMELLEGESLEALIDRDGPLPLHRIADLLLPIFSAVNAAHEEGVVHRDLKPANIFLCRQRDGSLVSKVLDFGISKLADYSDTKGLTGTDSILGTPEYMSPEQVRGSRDVTSASDQYALGVILYECATGRLPFTSESMYELMVAVVNNPPDGPRSLRPDLPEHFDAMVLRALAKKPEERFSSVNRLARELESFRWTNPRNPDPVATANTLPQMPAESRLDGLQDTLDPRTDRPDVLPSSPRSDTLSDTARETAVSAPPGRRVARGPVLAATLAVAVGLVAWSASRTAPTPSARPTAPARPAAVVMPIVTPVAVESVPATVHEILSVPAIADAGSPATLNVAVPARGGRGHQHAHPQQEGSHATPASGTNAMPVIN